MVFSILSFSEGCTARHMVKRRCFQRRVTTFSFGPRLERNCRLGQVTDGNTPANTDRNVDYDRTRRGDLISANWAQVRARLSGHFGPDPAAFSISFAEVGNVHDGIVPSPSALCILSGTSNAPVPRLRRACVGQRFLGRHASWSPHADLQERARVSRVSRPFFALIPSVRQSRTSSPRHSRCCYAISDPAMLLCLCLCGVGVPGEGP